MPQVTLYTRAQALIDGTLIDATAHAQKIGFITPVAISERLHAELTGADTQHTDANIQDALQTLFVLIRLHPVTSTRPRMTFQYADIQIQAISHTDENNNPVLTLIN